MQSIRKEKELCDEQTKVYGIVFATCGLVKDHKDIHYDENLGFGWRDKK